MDRLQSQGIQSGWHEKTTRTGPPRPISGGLQRGPLQDMGARPATGGCVVGVDAEPGLHHQGAVWRAVLALIIRALAAGLAVTGSFPGRSQVRRTSGAEGLIGAQALDLPCLHASLAGARARTPRCREPSVLAGLSLTRLQGRGPGQVGTVARRSHVEVSPQLGHTDDISALCAGATL